MKVALCPLGGDLKQRCDLLNMEKWQKRNFNKQWGQIYCEW